MTPARVCDSCKHEAFDHYGPGGGVVGPVAKDADYKTLWEHWDKHHCHACDKAEMQYQMQRDKERDSQLQKKRVRLWVAAVVVAAIIAGVAIFHRGEHDAAYNAGAAWAKNEFAAGYGNNNPNDPDPCDDSQAVAYASAGYDFANWDAGCQSVGEG